VETHFISSIPKSLDTTFALGVDNNLSSADSFLFQIQEKEFKSPAKKSAEGDKDVAALLGVTSIFPLSHLPGI